MLSFLVMIALVSTANADLIPLKRNRIITTSGRIVGGENAVIETHPYQVSLEVFEKHDCGATIISSDYVVTAGHCVDLGAKYLRVRAGTSFVDNGGRLHQVAEVIRHEKYYTNSEGIPFNDIALLRVEEPFQFDDKRQPIGLFEINEEAKAGISAIISGWGYTNEWEYDGQLQTVTMPIVSKGVCNNAYKIFGGLPEGQICAGYYGVGGKDACHGDSGGPMAIDGRLAGIVSWGIGCAYPEFPGIYTEIAHYRDWINRYVEF